MSEIINGMDITLIKTLRGLKRNETWDVNKIMTKVIKIVINPMNTLELIKR